MIRFDVANYSTAFAVNGRRSVSGMLVTIDTHYGVLKVADVVAELLGGQNELVATAAVTMAVRFRKLLIG
jgi:hypothetical protein